MTVLDDILAHKREEVAERTRRRRLATLASEARDAAPARGFAAAMARCVAEGRAAVIAEIKKASPSKGLIRADFDPAWLAARYAGGGATCLSVLTDAAFFQGRDEDLAAARGAVSLPVLRKDFTIEPYQVYESRCLGADCVLLIAAALSAAALAELHGLAVELGLDVLVEVHDAAELEAALALEPALIGINNRNLKTFETTLTTSLELASSVPASSLVVAESGIREGADVAALRRYGIHAFLIGESLMRAPDPGAALAALVAAAGC